MPQFNPCKITVHSLSSSPLFLPHPLLLQAARTNFSAETQGSWQTITRRSWQEGSARSLIPPCPSRLRSLAMLSCCCKCTTQPLTELTKDQQGSPCSTPSPPKPEKGETQAKETQPYLSTRKAAMATASVSLLRHAGERLRGSSSSRGPLHRDCPHCWKELASLSLQVPRSPKSPFGKEKGTLRKEPASEKQ